MTAATATVPVAVRGDSVGFAHGATMVMVEVRGPDRSLVHRRMLEVNAPPTAMQLAGPGPHALRATLGSGRVLHEEIDFDGVTPPPPVEFGLYAESPHETLQRAATVHNLREVRVGHLASPRYQSAWVRLWQRGDQGWSPTAPELELENCNWDDDAVRLNLELGRHQYLLQVGGPGIAPLTTALPGLGTTEVAIRPIVGEGRHPLELAVTPASPESATLLGYLASGGVTAIESIIAETTSVGRLVDGGDLYEEDDFAPDPAELAELVLYRKIADPNTAALGGYYLLRTGELERLHSWPANLANWMGWMSDGPIIRAWQLLRGGTPRQGETPRQRLLQAAQRGVPIYSEGMRLLVDGLKVVGRAHPEDAEVGAAIERMGAYAAATDWSRAVLTFTADDPEAPTDHPMPASRAGDEGTLMLYSVTIDDLVTRRLLRPGTRLHTTPRPARTVEAALTDEMVVTGAGLLADVPPGVEVDWSRDYRLPWQYGDPSQALLASQPGMMDGWYAWSTPDGETLDALRRRARQSPPAKEAEPAELPLDDQGIPSRAVRALGEAGLVTVADLLAFGLDEVETIPGIGPSLAADIRGGLAERGLTMPGESG